MLYVDQSKIKIHALASSFNRSKITIRCLESIFESHIPNNIDFKVTIVDDNSDDDTVNLIKLNFRQVNIIKSPGNLFWAGAMRYGWSIIKKEQFDYLFAFNDDTLFSQDFLKSINDLLLIHPNKIIAGSISSCSNNKKIIYGGVKRKSWHPLKFRGSTDEYGLKKPDTCNMNATLIPKKIIDDIGFLDKYFSHSKADFEFGLRAKKNKYNIISTHNPIGCAELNEKKNENYYYENSLFETLKGLNHPKKIPYRERYHYFKRYGGIFWIILFLNPYLKIIMLFFLRKYLFFKK